ncbi:hypothetical protein AKJ65_06740 [candidate division MSBL1 archaeon SCGC-AAA259E19]|uniref:Uncharacterized protein n=1 Tax=candidate division MSBL1 archaeon SCGC-AAA259E19 TaxID=1698264 RepID=A0A133UFV9_9EURY|nr:hypothetical protein AKJ65_06740 [candidate division MSBL1 archaeon SCGC-AAA259E19]
MKFLDSDGYNVSKMGEKYGEVDFLPFTSERKIAQSLVRFDGRRARYTVEEFRKESFLIFAVFSTLSDF